MSDAIKHPKHYTQGKIECWEVIEDWQLGYHTGTALKYICRHEHKDDPIQDIRKAIEFLERYLTVLDPKCHCGHSTSGHIQGVELQKETGYSSLKSTGVDSLWCSTCQSFCKDPPPELCGCGHAKSGHDPHTDNTVWCDICEHCCAKATFDGTPTKDTIDYEI